MCIRDSNRSSDFFEENIRDYEYEVTVNFGLEALEYDDIVLINAPFTREVHDLSLIHILFHTVDASDEICGNITVSSNLEERCVRVHVSIAGDVYKRQRHTRVLPVRN